MMNDELEQRAHSMFPSSFKHTWELKSYSSQCSRSTFFQHLYNVFKVCIQVIKPPYQHIFKLNKSKLILGPVRNTL